MFEVDAMALGQIQANCYLVKENGHCIIIDPGASYQKILDECQGYQVDAIVLTHGHFDHIGAVDQLVEVLQCPVYIYEDDYELAKNPNYNCSYSANITLKSPVKFLVVGDNQIGNFNFKVYQTPGHTHGSVVLLYKDCLFSGDTLFKGDIGRTDLYSGDENEMYESLQLFEKLDHSLKVYPGHGEATTIAEELKSNPYLRN